MKTIVIITLFLNTLCYSQVIKGVITFTPQKGVGDDTSLSEKAKKAMYYGYTYANKTSLQQLISKEETTNDTSFVEKNGLKFEKTATTNRASSVNYFKNYNTNIYRLEFSMNNDDVSIKDAIPVYKWILGTESKTIAGYSCKKASTVKKTYGREIPVTAWYCEELPINDGPMDYNGLPGLILQIEIGTSAIVKFEKLQIKNDVEISIEEPKNKSKMLTIAAYESK
jgi:GLPGLI family protein